MIITTVVTLGLDHAPSVTQTVSKVSHETCQDIEARPAQSLFPDRFGNPISVIRTVECIPLVQVKG